MKTDWISTKDKDRLPENGSEVLIVVDVRKWDILRPRRVLLAQVGFSKDVIRAGGTNALTGYYNIKGIFFSVPAILHPDSVTHWQPKPELPNE